MRILALLLLLAAVAVPLVCGMIVNFMYYPRLESNHRRFVELTPKILADAAVVDQAPPFPPLTFKSDAGPMLSTFVSAEGAGTENPETRRVRELLIKYAYWKVAPGQLKQLLEDPDFQSLDVSWLDELSNFDHWSLLSRPDLNERLTNAARLNGIQRITVFSSLAIPSFKDLRQWATLYALKKHGEGRAAQGLEIYRKAAQLIHSSGTLVGNMSAAAMLNEEPELAQAFKLKDWTPVPDEVVTAYKRLSWAWVALALEPWFGNVPDEFGRYMRTELGVCAAAWELNAGAAGYQDFLEPHVVFETDYSENLRRARDFQRVLLEKCDLSAIQAAWAKTPDEALSGWSRIPYVRRVLGLMLMSVAMPNYLGIYEHKAKQH